MWWSHTCFFFVYLFAAWLIGRPFFLTWSIHLSIIIDFNFNVYIHMVQQTTTTVTIVLFTFNMTIIKMFVCSVCIGRMAWQTKSYSIHWSVKNKIKLDYNKRRRSVLGFVGFFSLSTKNKLLIEPNWSNHEAHSFIHSFVCGLLFTNFFLVGWLVEWQWMGKDYTPYYPREKKDDKERKKSASFFLLIRSYQIDKSRFKYWTK